MFHFFTQHQAIILHDLQHLFLDHNTKLAQNQVVALFVVVVGTNHLAVPVDSDAVAVELVLLKRLGIVV